MKRHARKKYRVISRTRFTITITVLLLLVALAGTTVFSLASEKHTPEPLYHEVDIRAGDTLWEIAREYGSDKIDVRRTVYTICKVNHITPEELRPGQVIKVPAEL